MQSKQQSTEKTGGDVWPNVSLTRAELRSKVLSAYFMNLEALQDKHRIALNDYC